MYKRSKKTNFTFGHGQKSLKNQGYSLNMTPKFYILKLNPQHSNGEK